MTFRIKDELQTKDGMTYDRKVTFFHEKTGEVEAEYYYLKEMVNYLLSWGFTKDSLGEMRKSKASKVKKPYFSLQRGWYS